MWAAPAVLVATAAPRVAASDEVCPAASPIVATGYLDTSGACAGVDWTGDFFFTFDNATTIDYTLTEMTVARRSVQTFPRTPPPVTGAWVDLAPTAYAISTPAIPSTVGIQVSGRGNIQNIGNTRWVELDANNTPTSAGYWSYRVSYTLTGPGLPRAGCTYTFLLSTSTHCE